MIGTVMGDIKKLNIDTNHVFHGHRTADMLSKKN